MSRLLELHLVERVRTSVSPLRLANLRNDMLYRNSFFIMLSSTTASGLGLLFWLVAAHYYSIENIGLAATLISATGLLTSLACVGLDQSLIRYFPTRDKSRIFGTALKMDLLISFFIVIVFLLGSSIWMPNLVTSPYDRTIFLVLTCAMSAAYIVHTAFVGARVAKYGWAQNLMLGVRLVLLIPFVALGSLGLLIAILLSYAITLPVSGLNLFKTKIRVGRIDWAYLRESLWFSTGNYIANILSNLSSLTLPLIVFSLIGSKAAAIYYMSLSIATIVYIVPYAFTTSLFVEGSHGENLGDIVKRSGSIMFVILVPMVILLMLLGGWVLGILGQAYVSEGLGVLYLMIISSMFLAMFMIESTVLKIRGRVKSVMALSAVNSISFFSLSYVFVMIFDMEGIGFAWLASYVLTALLGLLLIRDLWRKA